MLLSGFTFIRNAKKYDFPIRECIESMLDIVDELIVNIGRSEDGTDELLTEIQRLSPKIKFIHSVWDENKTDRGLVLSEQTNLALAACQGRWCLYLQADEALHESELAQIRNAVEKEDQKPLAEQTEGFRFRYFHFYGGYTLIQRPWNWYPSEIRIIRKSSGAQSYGDAQTFRGTGDNPLSTTLLDAHVFHYGHARKPELMARKIKYFHRFWHGDKHRIAVDQAYKLHYPDLVWFWATHPRCYNSRVREGTLWSPKPAQIMSKNLRRIVILTGRKPKDPFSQHQIILAEEVKKLLSAHINPATQVVCVHGLRAWLKTVVRNLLVPRGSIALIDLDAEKRSLFLFLGWLIDACTVFGLRVAHSPTGKLSKFRQKFYNRINWCSHENIVEGFFVPGQFHAKQLVKWLGVNLL